MDVKGGCTGMDDKNKKWNNNNQKNANRNNQNNDNRNNNR